MLDQLALLEDNCYIRNVGGFMKGYAVFMLVMLGLAALAGLTSCAPFREPCSDCESIGPEVPVLAYNEELERGPGDCAVWATVTANRQRGLAEGEVYQAEYSAARRKLGTTDNGTPIWGITGYYKELGFSVMEFGVDECSTWIAEDIKNGCSVMLMMYKNLWTSHIETVVGMDVKKCEIYTNSWGVLGKVKVTEKELTHTRMPQYNGDYMAVTAYTICKGE